MSNIVERQERIDICLFRLKLVIEFFQKDFVQFLKLNETIVCLIKLF